MKRFIRIISLFLVIALLMPSLISCGGYKSKYDTVMEYNGIKLTEEFYNYWLATFKRNILASQSDAKDTEEFWNQPFDDERTVEEYFTEILNDKIINYLIAQDLYKKNSLKLSDKTKSTIKADIDEKIDFYGGRGSLNKTLSEMMLNIDALEEIYLWEAKHDLVYDYLFGEGGPLEVSDEELVDYYESNYYHINYVVFYLTDDSEESDGTLSPEEMEQKQKKISEFEGKLESTPFETLISDYSEYDTSKYPNGFFMSVNEVNIWGLDIYTAVKEADVGEICKIEEEEAIFYVKKYELTSFENMSEIDIAQLTDIGFFENATAKAYSDFYKELAKNVKINDEVMKKYKLSEIKANPHYSI